MIVVSYGCIGCETHSSDSEVLLEAEAVEGGGRTAVAGHLRWLSAEKRVGCCLEEGVAVLDTRAGLVVVGEGMAGLQREGALEVWDWWKECLPHRH